MDPGQRRRVSDWIRCCATGHAPRRTLIVVGGSEQHTFMYEAAQDALRMTAEFGTRYHAPDEVRAPLSRRTGRVLADESVTHLPPFYCKFGKNLTVGRVSSSTWPAASRTPGEPRSATGRSSGTPRES